MYTVYADDLLLYHPQLINDGYAISNPVVTLEENKSGSFTFTLLPTNVMYNQLTKLKTIITVYDDGEEIFRGRILDDEKDFYNRKSIYCEGQLSFLLDSIVRPYADELTVLTYFRFLIENHNSQVEETKQFKVGNVDIEYALDTFIFGNDKYTNTWDELNYQLIDYFGGRIVVRLEEDGRYIDYLAESEEINDQIIEFGVNMIDITQYISAVDVVTCLIPLGAKDDNGNYLTIESVNDGRDYIENETGINLFGKITKTCIWEDIADPNDLMNEAEYYLDSNIEMAVTLTVKAVDLHLLNVDTSRIKHGDNLRVISNPHGLDNIFKCSKVVLKLQNPENNEYSLGAAYTTLTDKQNDANKNVIATQGQIDSIKNIVDQNTAAVKDANKKVTTIEQKVTDDAIVSIVTSSTVYKDNLNDKVSVEEVISKINQSDEEILISASRLNLEGAVTISSLDKTVLDKVNSSIVSVENLYALSSSPTDSPTSDWVYPAPDWEDGKYMWYKNVTTYTDGTTKESTPTCLSGATGQQGPQGENGANGNGVSSITRQYYLSTSKTVQTGGSWVTTAPAWSKDKYLWIRDAIEYTNGTIVYTTPYCDNSWEAVNDVEAQILAWCYNNDTTYINGSKIYAHTITTTQLATDSIKSLNYVENTSGSFLNLADGSFDSKYLKWDKEGNLTANSGFIGGITLTSSGLSASTVTQQATDDWPEIKYGYSIGNDGSILVYDTGGGRDYYLYLDADEFVMESRGTSSGSEPRALHMNSSLITFEYLAETYGYVGVSSKGAMTLYGLNSVEIESATNINGTTNITGALYVNGTAVSLNGHTHSYLPLTGGTLSGSLFTSGTGETQVGVKYSGGSLYFWGNNSSGTRGIYDSLGGYVINFSGNTPHFNGTVNESSHTHSNYSPLGCRTGNGSAVLLYSGTSTAPSFSVTNIEQYKYFLVRMGDSSSVWATWIFVPYQPNDLPSSFRGIGGWETANNTYGGELYFLRGTVTRSGADGTVNIASCWMRRTYNITNNGSSIQCYIYKVYGVK